MLASAILKTFRPLDAAFPPMHLTNTLGEYAASKGLKVLRIAEASKYPHVTYFFDGGEEKDLPNTDKIIVPRKDVATYDLYPKMSAYEVADKLIGTISKV